MVDLSTKEFDLRDAAEAGSWCHLLHPVTRYPLEDEEGKPCRILIQGVDARGFDKAAAKSLALAAGEQPHRGPITDQYLLNTIDKDVRKNARELSEISLAWECLEWEGKPVDSRHAAADMYAALKWIREQLMAHILERQNYAGNGSAPS